MGGIKRAWPWFGILAVACAGEPSDHAAQEISRASLSARAGVEKIRHSLPLAERGFGEGVAEVEAATKLLGALESDRRLSLGLRLQAIVSEARAWDDAQRAILGARLVLEPAADGTDQSLFAEDVLREKAFPSRVAAENAYQRALAFWCEHRADDASLLPEIIDGVQRYRGSAPSLDDPCP